MTILQTLEDLLLDRFMAAGFDIPEDMTEGQREEFVFHALENAAIVPADEYNRLLKAAHQVVTQWPTNELAHAVRALAAALPSEKPRINDKARPA